MSDSFKLTIGHDMEGATTLHTVKLIGDALETEYPGWMWFVEVKGGIAIIKSMHADPRQGFVIKLQTGYYSGSDLKKQVLRAGGEMLERLGMPRRKADWDRINHAPQGVMGYLSYSN